MGSIPICAARFGLIVLIGRITALQAEGSRFKSYPVHQKQKGREKNIDKQRSLRQGLQDSR